jgi:protein-disulfide isomerase
MLKKNIKYVLFALGLLASCAASAASVEQLFHNPQDPVGGDPHGSVTVVEFFDYQCSHCAAMGPIMAAVMSTSPDTRFVFKEYPVRGPMSDFTARAALAANLQGKYEAMHLALLSADQPYTQKSVYNIAQQVGVDVEKLQQNMNNDSIKSLLSENHALASALHIRGTPAFFIGRTNATNLNEVQYVLGEMSKSQLKNAIKKFST